MYQLQTFDVHHSQGLISTLRKMRELEKLSFQNSEFVSWVYKNFYSTCIGCLPGKIYKFIRENFKYVDDLNDEDLTAPYVLLNTKIGDCDDFALFAKTIIDLIPSMDWRANYLLLGENKNEWTHIVVKAYRKKFGQVIDSVFIDGANEAFNFIPSKYKWMKLS